MTIQDLENYENELKSGSLLQEEFKEILLNEAIYLHPEIDEDSFCNMTMIALKDLAIDSSFSRNTEDYILNEKSYKSSNEGKEKNITSEKEKSNAKLQDSNEDKANESNRENNKFSLADEKENDKSSNEENSDVKKKMNQGNDERDHDDSNNDNETNNKSNDYWWTWQIVPMSVQGLKNR